MKLILKIYHIIKQFTNVRTASKLGALVIIMLSAIACSTTRTLDENEYLYKKNEIKLEDADRFEKLSLKSNMKKKLNPEPNDRFLGFMPFKLWVYNLVGDSIPEKGLRHWIRKKMGEAPVIYRSYYVKQNTNDIQQYLFNKGYFNAETNSSVEKEKKKVSVNYNIELNRQFVYDTIIYPEIKDSLTKYIAWSQANSLLKKGDAYDLEMLKEERLQINKYLKNNGFHFFDPNFLVFEVDSNDLKATVKINLKVKKNIPKQATRQYYINNITVDSDYSLDKLSEKKDSVSYDSITVLYNNNVIKPRVITNSVMFNQGDLYSYNSYIQTLNKFSGLGIYKFTNIKYVPVHPDSSLLNANIYLTQSVPKSVRTVVRAVTKSNDYMGPELTLSYRDRNFFNGAELFTLNLNTSFETQFGNRNDGGNSYEVGFDANLSVPRFIFPIIDLNKYLSKKYTPKTNLRTGYSYQFRTKYFKMNTFNLLYGYNWQETATKSHDLKTINLSYSRLTDRTQEFDAILKDNELLSQSFKEKLILSLSYTYKYNNALGTEKNSGLYFSVNPEVAGQLLSLYNYLARGYFPSTNHPAKILGIKYSQYARISADFRYYKSLGANSQFASKIFAGVGTAYGNSDVLPYIKQFYVGGASDMRSFFAHTVGPGSYSPPDSLKNTYFEQVGEIKLEANLEYRFGIIGFLKGAFFIDAGNVWLLDYDEQKPGGQFNWNTMFNELAVGSGFGLRFDASVFVLRFDLGIPLRKPWLPENDRWVFDRFDPQSAMWRRNNLILNIAIGYPF